MSLHDMEAHPDERYYARQYWHWLEPEVGRLAEATEPRVLDIGCGQGRMSLPVARALPHGRVIGVDLTGPAIAAARAKAAHSGLKNVDFHEADAVAFLESQGTESFDLALMTEVSFFMPRFGEAIAATRRLLKNDGVLFASFRSQYYYLLHSVRDRDWRSARLAVEARQGEWGGSSAWFSWQTPEDVLAILKENGFSTIAPLRGIGVCSGIANDPLDAIARPSALTDREQEQLMDLELSLSEEYAAAGRYILAVAKKHQSEATTE